jgi:hypothetical protein
MLVHLLDWYGTCCYYCMYYWPDAPPGSVDLYVCCMYHHKWDAAYHPYILFLAILAWDGFFLLLSLYLVIKVGYPIQSNDLVDFFHLSDILVCLLLIYMWLRELHLDVVAYLLVHVEYLLTFLMWFSFNQLVLLFHDNTTSVHVAYHYHPCHAYCTLLLLYYTII